MSCTSHGYRPHACREHTPIKYQRLDREEGSDIPHTTTAQRVSNTDKTCLGRATMIYSKNRADVNPEGHMPVLTYPAGRRVTM